MHAISRVKQIEKLEEYINEKHSLLNGILNSLEWTQESLKDEVKVRCSVNSDHWIPESSLSDHVETCKWITDGYLKEELENPSDSSFFYQKSANVIPVSVDHAVTQKILFENGLLNYGYDSSAEFPRTADRLTVHLNPEQRLAVYNYVVESSKAAAKPKSVTLEDLMIDLEKRDNEDEKPKEKTQLEILAEMRDYKRRRQSYRAKNVHITKKSYTEIMKEVIENQTNYLTDIRKHESSDNSKRTHADSDVRDTKMDDSDSSDGSRHREHHSKHKKEKHSKHKSSRDYSPKRKKHKRDRSQSRSPSRHRHKKKQHKRKRSHS